MIVAGKSVFITKVSDIITATVRSKLSGRFWKLNIFNKPNKYIHMFKNYIKASFRNLFKNKGYSFLNIGGLAIGMACAWDITSLFAVKDKPINN